MNYPNKIYVSEYKGKDQFDKDCHYVILTAASDIDTAAEYVKEKIGIRQQPVWIMDAVYPTIYTCDGSKPLDKQVKILSNNNYHSKK